MAVAPDVQCCNSIIWALSAGSQWTKALEVLEALETSELQGNAITFSACLGACERSDRCREAQQLLANLDEQMLLDSALQP